MPITIWEPARYVAGFATDASGNQINGSKQPAPLSHDTKVREVSRFKGWTQEYFADTGECEFTFSGYDVQPSDIKRGRMVEVDGKHYEIERVKWAITENGHECTVAGRDMGGKLDRWADAAHMKAKSGTYGTTIAASIKPLVDCFFGKSYGNGYNMGNGYAEAYPWKSGWWRDSARLSSYYAQAFEVEGTASKTVANMTIENVLSYGAGLRLLCNLFGIGYRFELDFDESTQLYSVCLKLYNRANNGVKIASIGRGVSGWEYEEDGRNEVNALVLTASTQWKTASSQDKDNPAAISALVKKISGVSNYAEQAEAVSMAVNDVGQVPEESDTSFEAARRWLLNQGANDYAGVEKSVKFDYSNEGAYRYGEHFFLGSPVELYDDFTGITTTQRLTGVKTTYDAGNAKGYGFEFGSQRITQADILRRKFAAVDSRTYGQRAYS